MKEQDGLFDNERDRNHTMWAIARARQHMHTTLIVRSQNKTKELTKREGARARARQVHDNMRPGQKITNTNVVHRYHRHSL